MNPSVTHQRTPWNANNEPTELSLPVRGRDPLSDRIEQQFDQLLELLAADQAVGETDSLSPLVRAQRVAAHQVQPPEMIATASDVLELSIVMPCLDEAETIGNCVLKAMYALEKLGVSGEVIVADNGSRDDSVDIAEALGARIVHVEKRGYGAALMAGIAESRGKYVVMADSDESYDFTSLGKFYERLCEGADLVLGCRLPAGGGRIMPGAMPRSQQWINPLLTRMVRAMFRAPVNDVTCGMRGLRKDFYERLNPRCTGMEFGAEMIIKSARYGGRISEIPITFYSDGRTVYRPHLRSCRDVLRTMRFYILQGMRWTLCAPSAALASCGSVAAMFAMWNVNLAGVTLDVHTLLVAMLAIIVAGQLMSTALLAKCYASGEGLLVRNLRLEKLARVFTLERCLALAACLTMAGASMIAWKTIAWAAAGFGDLDYSSTMKCLIPAVAAVILGIQTATTTFLLSVFRLARR